MITFCGHKEVADRERVEAWLYSVCAELIAQGADEFYLGGYGGFDAKGYAPLYARESFENCWIQYEKLGKNGVMQDIRAKFLALPTHDEA